MSIKRVLDSLDLEGVREFLMSLYHRGGAARAYEQYTFSSFVDCCSYYLILTLQYLGDIQR